MLVKIEKLNKEEILVVSSRKVAGDFEKEHSKVLRSIEELSKEIPPKVALSYFVKSEYSRKINQLAG